MLSRCFVPFKALALGVVAACGNDPASAGAKPDTALNLLCPADPVSPTPLRRLTRFEYGNTLRDLLGMDLDANEMFPPDEISLGFDDQAGTIGVTELHVDGYFKVAEGAGDWLVANPDRLAGLVGCALDLAECRESFVRNFGRRVLRRPVTDPEATQLLSLFDDTAEPALSDGAAKVVSALLQAPEFLYRFERTPNVAASEQIASPWVLASRLSFLLWGAGPDQALLDAAQNGALASPADVAREAERLLADPRARQGAAHFYMQWLDLVHFDGVEKDSRLLPRWTPELKHSMQRETERFLEALLWEEDARLETLLLAPFTYVNDTLADFYGLPLPGVTDGELVKVSFPDAAQRAGLLTQGSILSSHAKADQSSPIHRGKFVREKLFCTIPPPPPADLIVTPPRLDPRKTTRERFSAHREQQSCALCHELLDPVGLIFEHYDATGHWRDTEADVPVDATGYLAQTDVTANIDGVPMLARELAGSAEVRECVVRQWFRYAYGRGEGPNDSCTLDKLNRAFEESDGDLRGLLVALTQTNPFLLPTPAPEVEEP
jgi:hypothetical protein